MTPTLVLIRHAQALHNIDSQTSTQFCIFCLSHSVTDNPHRSQPRPPRPAAVGARHAASCRTARAPQSPPPGGPQGPANHHKPHAPCSPNHADRTRLANRVWRARPPGRPMAGCAFSPFPLLSLPVHQVIHTDGSPAAGAPRKPRHRNNNRNINANLLPSPPITELYPKPCDTGTPIPQLAAEFPTIDFSRLDPVYPDKTSPAGVKYAYSKSAVLARAQEALKEIYEREDLDVVVVVSHSGFLRTGVAGVWFGNADYRVFDFGGEKEGRFKLVEWEMTKGRGGMGTARNETVSWPEGIAE